MSNLERLVEDLRIKFRLLFDLIHSTNSGILYYYDLIKLEVTNAGVSASEALGYKTTVEEKIELVEQEIVTVTQLAIDAQQNANDAHASELAAEVYSHIYEGIKITGVDAGLFLGQESITDDYLYKCVQIGTSETTTGAKDGTAIWKKQPLFQSIN